MMNPGSDGPGSNWTPGAIKIPFCGRSKEGISGIAISELFTTEDTEGTEKKYLCFKNQKKILETGWKPGRSLFPASGLPPGIYGFKAISVFAVSSIFLTSVFSVPSVVKVF